MYIQKIYIKEKPVSSIVRFKKNNLKRVGNTLSDDFHEEYRQKCDIMDNFFFLNDMYWICEEDKNDLSATEMIESYREYNKRLLNYLNAVYVYVQFCYNFGKSNDKLRELMERYFSENIEYRFLLGFRNCVVHQGTIVKAKYESSWLINVDELIRAEEKNIEYKLEKKKRGKKYGKEIYEFKRILRTIKEERCECVDDLDTYIRSDILYSAHRQLVTLHEEAKPVIYTEFIEPLLNWLLDHIYSDSNKYWYTIYVNEEIEDSEFEPNRYLEFYINELKNIYGEESKIFKYCIELLKRRKYNYLFECDCSLQDYLDSILS